MALLSEEDINCIAKLLHNSKHSSLPFRYLPGTTKVKRFEEPLGGYVMLCS
jgi:hypothetical protein